MVGIPHAARQAGKIEPGILIHFVWKEFLPGGLIPAERPSVS